MLNYYKLCNILKIETVFFSALHEFEDGVHPKCQIFIKKFTCLHNLPKKGNFFQVGSHFDQMSLRGLQTVHVYLHTHWLVILALAD